MNYIKTNSHDSTLITHDVLQNYDNKVIINTDIEIQNIKEKKPEQLLSIKEHLNINRKNEEQKKCFWDKNNMSCYELNNNHFDGMKKLSIIFKNYKSKMYKRGRFCFIKLFNDIYCNSKSDTILEPDIKAVLIESYKKYIPLFGENIIYNVFKNEGKNLKPDKGIAYISHIEDQNEKIRTNQDELQNIIGNALINYINSDIYLLTLLDLLLLGIYYNIGIMCVYDYNQNAKKRNSVQFITNKENMKEFDKYIILKIARNPNIVKDRTNIEPSKNMLIINNDDTIFHTEDTLKNIENTNIEYISFEDYITKKRRI